MILYSPRYLKGLKEIFSFIALDSVNRAEDFVEELSEKVKSIEISPYMYRASIYFNDVHIRDMIYKGYTITFHVDDEQSIIRVLGIKKYKEHF